MWNQTAQHMALVPFSNYGGPMYEDAYYEDEKPMVEENAEPAEDERDVALHPEQRYTYLSLIHISEPTRR